VCENKRASIGFRLRTSFGFGHKANSSALVTDTNELPQSTFTMTFASTADRSVAGKVIEIQLGEGSAPMSPKAAGGGAGGGASAADSDINPSMNATVWVGAISSIMKQSKK
jgi:hypothetical protein